MSKLNRISNLFHRLQVNREIEAELNAHIEMRTEENMASGLPRDEARRNALLRFGNRTSTRERTATADTALSFDTLARDIRFAARQLIHSPGFAITAIVTLAVAIGANAIVFSVLNALVLRPLNLPDAQRLVAIENRGTPFNSYADWRDIEERNRTFDGISAYNFESVGVNIGDKAEQEWIYEATGNYFDVLQVKPYLGRFFHASDDHGPDSNPYLVISYAFWQTRYQGNANVIGRKIELNRHAFTILGVAPPGFRGNELVYSPDLWVPVVDQMQIEGDSNLASRTARGLWLIGRLKPNVTPDQATSDLNAVGASMKKAYPKDDEGLVFSLARPGLVGNMLGGPVRAFVAGLMLLSALILLAACTNLGSLFAARAADRTREIALRLALGSTRQRILRQLLTESVLVALAGGVAGIAASAALLRALSAWQPVPNMPLSVPVNPDGFTYLVAVVLALASGLLCGLAPVRQIFAAAPWEVVKGGGTRATTGGRGLSLRDVLLVIQVAVCAVLMTSSLVAVRGLARSLHSDFGFDPQNTVLVHSDLLMAGYSGDRARTMQRRMLDTASAQPGVLQAGMINVIPLGLGWSDNSIFPDQTTDFKPSNAVAEASQYRITPNYFSAARTSLLAGRSFTWDDNKDSPKVVVINRELARKLFGSVTAAIGNHFKMSSDSRYEVVGVVEDGKYKTLTEDPRPVYFEPLSQDPSSETWIVTRSSRDVQHLGPQMHEAMHNLDPAMPFTVISWPQQLDSALFAARVATISLGVLGALGAMLAMTGIFGMASYSVGKRIKEMGIRIALGASHGQVLNAAVGRAFRLLAFGSIAGLALGLAATRVLASIVYQASPRDPVVLAGAVAAMLLVGLIAAWAPARRALGVDPSRLMREE